MSGLGRWLQALPAPLVEREVGDRLVEVPRTFYQTPHNICSLGSQVYRSYSGGKVRSQETEMLQELNRVLHQLLSKNLALFSAFVKHWRLACREAVLTVQDLAVCVRIVLACCIL